MGNRVWNGLKRGCFALILIKKILSREERLFSYVGFYVRRDLIFILQVVMNLKFPFWATIIMCFAVCILCALGWWQVQRLYWKLGILDRVDAAYETFSAGRAEGFDLDFDMQRDDFMIAGKLKGRYMHEKSVLIQSRVHDRTPGYHVLTPFVVQKDQSSLVVLVNRGWVPLEVEREEGFTMFSPLGNIEVSGMLAMPPETPFSPMNMPDKNMWYQIDLAQIQAYLKVDNMAPKILYMSTETGREDGVYPVAIAYDLRGNIKNNHAQYAFFWFTMAFVLVLVYCARFIVPQVNVGR